MADYETYVPDPRSKLPHLGSYRRRIAVSMERMFENALDWEHLPYVHSTSFSEISCEDFGPWGWRALVRNGKGAESLIELRLERSLRRWISRTLEGVNAGAEIWTHAFEVEPRVIEVVIDFFAPDVEPERRAKVGAAFTRLYRRLYDEDVAMMTARQIELDSRIGAVDTSASFELGAVEELRLPMLLELGGRRVVVREDGGELVAYGAVCPHQMGPLADAPLQDGVVQCPWHGYRFDVRTGDCVSGQSCRLLVRPVVEVNAGRARIRFAAPAETRAR